jgi:O-antigen/teichoic acid export membrane protein
MTIHKNRLQSIPPNTPTPPEGPAQHTSPLPPAVQSQERSGAHALLKRTPSNYAYNQVYGLWFYLSSFLFTVLLTRGVNPTQYGIYAVLLTTCNTLLYIVAFGLEDALTTFVPRVLSELGEAAAAQLTRYLLSIRLVLLFLTVALILFGLPSIAALIAILPFTGATSVANSLRDPALIQNSVPVAFYVLGNGLTNMFAALCAARMRMLIVLFVNGGVQVALLLIGFVLLHFGYGIIAILWLQAAVSLFSACAFALWQARFLFKRVTGYHVPHKTILQLGFSAWLTNLASGALFKQVSIIMLGVFAVSLINIGYFNLSYQLADSANVLLVAGFGGVGASAISAAFVGNNHERLARTWQALIKIETLLAAPILVFCLFNASNIAHALYGSRYDGVGPLLAIFLFFNLLSRILGTTIHQASLYVVGRAKLVALSQWIGILIIIASGIVFIPSFGAAGALIADGLAKVVAALLLLVFLLPLLPRQYPLDLLAFSGRFLLALFIAAIPSLIWHPDNRILLVASGCIFLVLCFALLMLIKPLTDDDLSMLQQMSPRFTRYFRPFTRKTKTA